MKLTLHRSRRSLLKAAIIVVGIAAIAGGAALVRAASTTKSGQHTLSTAAAQTASAHVATTIKGVPIESTSYYAVSLTSTDPSAIKQYYGKLQAIGTSYLRLTPAYYSDASGKLVLLGSELHAPEPVMYIHADKVASLAKLAPSGTQYQAIQSFQKTTPIPIVHDATAAETIDAYVKPAQYQAVFFDNGTVFFGALHSATSSQLFTNSSQVFAFQESNHQVNLVKVPVSALASYNTGHIIFWENLANSGKVSTAITTYLHHSSL
ncbi:MAG TPA: hypothetical protein VFN56_01800 [Candidatus Saccharimonadales bacterium]|nr:hypothetical protein [Candidatus Saccharimonadales bacterium]